MSDKYPVTVGEIAYVKITEEPVFVLGFEPNTALNGPQFLRVSRAQSTRDGVVYKNETFRLDELQTGEALLASNIDFAKRTKAIKDQYIAEQDKSMNAYAPKEALPN